LLRLVITDGDIEGLQYGRIAGLIAVGTIGAPAMSVSIKDRLIKKFEDEIQTLNTELRLELPRRSSAPASSAT
jgi:Flp pilus assembly pilin Flp